MAPEQARGEVGRLDARCDVFGLGAMLCEILTGRPPYGGRSAAEVLAAAARPDQRGALERLAACGADAGLLRLTTACLAADPAGRPPDGRTVAEAVAAYRAGVQERLRAAEVETAAARARAAEERKRRHVTARLAAALLALVGLGGFGAWWYARDREAKRAEQAERLRREQGRDGDAEAALDEAEGALRRADWAAARAALERAEGRLGGEGPDGPRERLRRGQGDLQTAATLERIRLDRALVVDNAFAAASASRAYAKAFAAYGVRGEAGRLDEAAARVAASPIRDQLAAALDDWSFAEPDDALRGRLRALVLRADPHDWRRAGGPFAPPVVRGIGPGVELQGLSPALVVQAANELSADDPPAAVRVLEQARRLHPDDFWINFELARRLQEDDADLGRAVEYYRAALAIRPDCAVASFNLGVALSRLGRVEEADAAFEQAGASLRRHRDVQAEDPEPDFVRGRALAEQGKLEEALQALRAKSRNDPDNPDAHFALGLALYERNRLDEALSEFNEATHLKPRDAAAWDALGRVLWELGRRDEAAAAYQRAVFLEPDLAVAQYRLGVARLEQREPGEAASALRRAADLRPDDAYAHYFLGLALLREGRPEEEAAELRRANELGARDPNWRQPSADALRQAERAAANR
jgi:serine/threonine-protein kinase